MRRIANPKTKKKKLTRTQLIKSLDKVFSIFIRQRDSGICFTCGKKDDPKYMQNGHYVSRGKFATRWDERNCHCQCMRCNVFLKGNYPIYSEKLIKKYGYEVIQELNRKGQTIARHTSKDLTSKDLEEKIEHYKKLV